MRTSPFLLAVVLSGALAAQAGTVAGTVTDATGAPLAGANVSLSGLAVSAASGPDGRYAFEARPGAYELRASFLGYAPQRVSVRVVAGETTTQDFALLEDFVGTDELVVLGGRGEARTVVPSTIHVEWSTWPSVSSRTRSARRIRSSVPSSRYLANRS